MHDEGNPVAPNGRRYLKGIHIDAFGCFFNHDIGPFAPGMNVVYGGNESGKTTMRKFIEGVLFGWEDSRGGKNAYRPEGVPRSGSLSFALLANDRDVLACSRARNADGLRPAEAQGVLGGVERDSYGRVFSLDGDALGPERGIDEMLDRLLTASSGAAASPASISLELSAWIKACFSRSASKPGSIPNIERELSLVRQEIAAARKEDGMLVGYDGELASIRREIPLLRQALRRSDDRIRELACVQEALRALEDRKSPWNGEHARENRGSYGAGRRGSARLLALSCALIAFCLLFALIGVFLSKRGLIFASLLLLVAAVCCSAAFALGKAGAFGGLGSRGGKDAGGRVRDPLQSDGSFVKDGASAGVLRGIGVRGGGPGRYVPSDQARRRELCRSVGVGEEDALRQVALLLRRECESRDSLQARLLSMSERAGALDGILSEARASRDLQDLRVQESRLEEQLDLALREYAQLLIAKQVLEQAVRSWEEHSQPAVYSKAGELMELMSDGRWRRVVPDGAGGVLLCDRSGVSRKPSELSLGTCRQLHLALRIALLEASAGVGESLPVIADEILAHFDDTRRGSAVLALAHLARSRQVILLTCHSDIVQLVRRASPDVNILRL